MRKSEDPPPLPPEHFRLLKEHQAAQVLGVSTRTLQRWRVDGGGPVYTELSKRGIRYTVTALREFAEARERRSTSDRG